ncbi:galectin-4-like [Sorex fumeus]|uniref:galectin-4-like n=1 Tax=Sorex fumeus TaxID=62283 RepID=UPI0024ACA247|nr:galectin-4-like [Sorex fumeus]
MTFVPAPGYYPSYNPTLPFNKSIPGGLDVGMFINIEGVANKVMKRFAVNFALGPEPEANIAFHFNPRFDGSDMVVFNSRESGQWNKEERKRGLPFKKGEPFELLVMVMEEHYKVLVNGSPFYEFGHRISLQKVTHLNVEGDLKLQSITFVGGSSTSRKIKGPHVLTSQPVPYVVSLQGGLTPNRTIVIRGFVSQSASRFDINFNVGSTGDVALHISARISEDAVVRNSLQKGEWGPEERSISYNPFRPGLFFDLSITASIHGFQVFASGQHIFDYRYRMLSFTLVNVLQITGDVSLSYVQV